MTPLDLAREERLAAGDLIAEVAGIAPRTGPNSCDWPGLTVYRCVQPQPPQCSDVHTLALCCVMQGRKRFVIDGSEYMCGPFNYLLLHRGMRFEAEIIDAAIERPYLSFVLPLDPVEVRAVASEIAERRTTTFSRPQRNPVPAEAHVSPVNQDLAGALLRFLRSTKTDADRRILAPMYLKEITYRLLQAEQVARLLEAATAERENNPVSDVIRYVRQHLSEPLTVADMAHHACMSPSALNAVFTEATGLAPYQFVKRLRLDSASALLIQGDLSVSEVSRHVGYASLSHFVNEFKRFYGATPREYASTQRQTILLAVGEAARMRVGAPA